MTAVPRVDEGLDANAFIVPGFKLKTQDDQVQTLISVVVLAAVFGIINAYLRPSPKPERIIYTDPKLAPGGAGPGDAPEPPPTVSAYTGAGDIPPPPGWNGPPNTWQGLYAPPLGTEAPSTPSPALYPGAPIPGPPPTVNGMLLPQTPAVPAEQAPPPVAPGTPMLPAEGGPQS